MAFSPFHSPFSFSPTVLSHHQHQPQHQLWSKRALRSHCRGGRHKRYWLPKSREWCPRLGLGTASSPSPPLTLQVDYAEYRHLSSCLAWLWDHLDLIGGTSWTAIMANSLQLLQADAAGVSMKICLIIVWTRHMLCEKATQPSIILSKQKNCDFWDVLVPNQTLIWISYMNL